MPEDVYVDLAYQGIELGSQLCMQKFTESEAYVQCPHPMPVGTAVVVHAGDGLEIPVRVARVCEQIAGAEKPAGMFVGASELEGQARDWWMGNVGATPTLDGADPANTEPVESSVEDPSPQPESEGESQAAAPEAAPEAEAPKEEAAPAKKKRRRRKKR